MSVLQQCYVKVTARRGLRGVRHDCRIVEQSTEKVPFSMNPTFNQTLELEVPHLLGLGDSDSDWGTRTRTRTRTRTQTQTQT